MGAPVSVPMQIIAMRANGAITANRIVKLDAVEGDVAATGAITETAFGVSQNTAADNAMVSVEVGNGAIVKLTAGAAIAIGARLMPQGVAGGKVITAAGATAVDCGVAMTAAGADGEIITAKFTPMGRSPVNV